MLQVEPLAKEKVVLWSILLPSMLRASCLTLEINGCYEVKIEESKKADNCRELKPDTSGLRHQCSATEPRQPDNSPTILYMQGLK